MLRLWMKARADALRPASVLAAVEIASLLGLGEFVSKPKPELEPMHDYGSNWTYPELRLGVCRKEVSRRVEVRMGAVHYEDTA
jgi:hypothetical protein